MRRELARVAGELFPSGSEPANAFTESVRAAEAVTGERMRDVLGRALQDSADLGVSVAVRQFENVGYGFDYTLANETARAWALRYTDEVLAQLGTTTARIVGQSVGRWIGNGEPLQALVNDLRPAFGKQRARLIASTEVTRAYAQGTKEAYTASGVVKKLVWQASMDERVCIYCGSLHGKVVGIEESFDGALPANLRERARPFALPPAHPGCILPGNLISAPGGIDAMAKSFYVGRCVEITLLDGSVLTVTKNHPILTHSGWVAAQFLDEGMYVLSAIGGDRIAAAINPDDQDVPAAVEQVFDSFMKSGDVSSVSVPPAAENLHGEGGCIKGNIDIVYANRLLLDNGVAHIPEIVGKDVLGGYDTGLSQFLGLGVYGPFVSGHLAPLRGGVGTAEHGTSTGFVGSCPACGHSLGAAADFDASLLQPEPKDETIDAQLATERLLGLASEIPFDVGADVGNLLSYTTEIDAGTLQSPRNGTDMNAELTSEFLGRFASEVASSQIVSIRQFDYSGHVYDLQSDMYELYICNGVIVKNCRCWISAQIDEPKRERKPKVPKPQPAPVPKPSRTAVTIDSDAIALRRANMTEEKLAQLFDIGPSAKANIRIRDWGDRVEINGEWIDVATGENIGECIRELFPEQKKAYLTVLSFEPGYIGNGVGMKVARQWFDELGAAGYEKAELYAGLTVGRYAWAKEGAIYADPGQAARSTQLFREWASQKNINLSEGEYPTFTSVLDVATYSHPRGATLTGKDITNRDVPPDMVLPLGKAFMLDISFNGHGGWNGIIDLEERRRAAQSKSVKGVGAKAANVSAYINGNNDAQSDALFFAAYLVDDDASVTPLLGGDNAG